MEAREGYGCGRLARSFAPGNHTETSEHQEIEGDVDLWYLEMEVQHCTLKVCTEKYCQRDASMFAWMTQVDIMKKTHECIVEYVLYSKSPDQRSYEEVV